MKKVLHHNVLVINKSWVPIHITNVRDAVGLVYVGAAKVVSTKNIVNKFGESVASEYEALDYDNWILVSEFLNESEYDVLHSSKASHFKPSVVALNGYNGVPKYEIKFCRSSIYERDNGQCQYCLKNLTKQDATLDHIIPKSRGGKNNWNNVVLCCKKCNDKKGSRTPQEADMSLISRPKKPAWVAVKFGKARTIRERDDWKKFTGSVEKNIA